MKSLRWCAAGVVLLLCAACTGAQATTSVDTPAPTTSSEPSPDGELVTSQETLPAESALDFADIATSAADVTRAWSRFGLEGTPPELEDGTALLFRGVGESGSCPVEFGRVQVDGDEVSLTGPQAQAGGTPTVRTCTADYRPRTLVVAVPLDVLPRGAFRFEGFALSATPLDAAPSGPSVLDPWTDVEPDLDVTSTPSRLASGGTVDLHLTTTGTSASYGAFPLLLERWADQRWLPVEGGRQGASHPATRAARNPLPADATALLATVDTSGLPPGDYRVAVRLFLGEPGGSTGVQGFFTVTG